MLIQMLLMDSREDTQLRGFRTKQKISLPMGSKAKDTLKSLQLNKDTSSYIWLSDSSSKSCDESPLDGYVSEDSVVSGPSSPTAALHSLRCRKCESLFSKLRRQGPLRKKQIDNDPASLSCDEWLLKKTWHPQRQQQPRGKLWVHLKRIRLRAAKQSDDDVENKAWALCSRPHVFLQRNLRCCKKMSGKPSKGSAKPVNLRRNRAKPIRPPGNGKHQRQKKRKSSENTDTSEHLSMDPIITMENKLPANDNAHHVGVQRLEKVPKKQSGGDVSSFMAAQANCSGLEGTRRVLKFDMSPNDVQAETQKLKHPHVHTQSAGGKLHEGQTDFTVKKEGCLRRPHDDLCEDLDVFRTPTDRLSSDSNFTKKSRPLRPLGTRKDSFRTMLAALGQGHNQIIKESHH